MPEHFAENVIAEHDALTPHSVLALWSTRISHLLPESANEYAEGVLGGLHAEMPSVVVAFGTSHLLVARTIESLTLFALGEWLKAHCASASPLSASDADRDVRSAAANLARCA